jgi:uncharacterized protein with LGFP repeats
VDLKQLGTANPHAGDEGSISRDNSGVTLVALSRLRPTAVEPDLPGAQKPPMVIDGSFPSVSDGAHVEQLVYGIDLASGVASEPVTAMITTGNDLFAVSELAVYDLVFERVDPGDLPAGSPVKFYWDQVLVASNDGSTPLTVAGGQRVEVRVRLRTPLVGTVPGDLGGTLSIAYNGPGMTVALTSQYIGVNPDSPIGIRWSQLGGAATLGLPRENEHPDSVGPGMRQMFQFGVLYQISGRGVVCFTPEGYAKWAGGTELVASVRDAVGLPLDDAARRAGGVTVQLFDFGAIVGRPEGTFVMLGAIYADYSATSHELLDPTVPPVIGLPLSDEQDIPDPYITSGRSQRYDLALYQWTPPTGAHYVPFGPIWNEYSAVTAGLPVSDPLSADLGGRAQHFQDGMVLWKPSTGAHFLNGPILDRFARLGYERSHFGYPTSEVQSWTNPASGARGSIVSFENGQIGWTSQDGTLELPPESITLQQNIETPSGTALGGFAAVTLRSDGSYGFVVHLHDSGFESYSFQVRVTLTTASGVQFMAQHSGSVGGTIGGGSRDDDHSEGGFLPWIRDNWPEARTATMSVSKSYEDTGVIGVAEEGLKDLLSFIAFDLVAGAEIALIIALGHELEDLTGVAVGGPGVLPGVLVTAGSAFLLGPNFIFPAIVAGVAVGAVTDALITYRRMTGAEMAEADKVFGGQIPYGLVWLTNLSASQNRKFTWPSIDNSILVNLGDAYDDPVHKPEPNSDYQSPGEVFIHELTHAWQIAHAFFSPGLACERLIDPSYAFGPPGPSFSSFTIEGQAQIVDYWYGGDRPGTDGHPAGTGRAMDPDDPYFGYIQNNIRTGVR